MADASVPDTAAPSPDTAAASDRPADAPPADAPPDLSAEAGADAPAVEAGADAPVADGPSPDTAAGDDASADVDPDTGPGVDSAGGDSAQPTDAAGGDSGSVGTPLLSGAGYGLVYMGAGTQPGSEAADTRGLDSRSPVEATFDTAGRLTGYVWTLSEFTRENEAPLLGTAVIDELAGDEHASLGRWNTGTTAGTAGIALTGNQGWHYAIGKRTAAGQLPASGIVTYQLLAATKPTHSSGAHAPGAFSGSLAIDFATKKVGFTFTLTVNGDSVEVSTAGGAASPGMSEATMLELFREAYGSALNQTSVQPKKLVQCMLFGPSAVRVGCAVYIHYDSTTSLQAAALFAAP